ncbi:MAG: dihydrodipicolinate synthase family protein [Flavobacteriaceae bacterium]|nr:dihydrodipicolinate synthase family protein [Flavobacteriaceae bacterium]|tara:strand:+ start:5463 stop:6368 length:906 start_codon:yes stop_codon:yes gene_type:complete
MEWKGVMPAITTKFDTHNQLDLDLFNKNLSFQMDSGVDAIVLAGSLGEASTLTQDEKNILTKNTVQYVNDKMPVVVNIAEQSTRQAIKCVEDAEKFGAKGLMVLPPMRYKSGRNETVDFFKSIANSTSLPIMIYNNPVDYGIEVTLGMFDELLKCDNIKAVKESTRDISNVTRLRNSFGSRLKIMTGVDTIALESLLMGADGWIAGLVCAFPMETVAIYKLQEKGKVKEAIEIYRWFLPLLELDINPKLVQNIKLAESILKIGSEYVRLPRKPLSGKERENVLNIINIGIKNRPDLSNYNY